MKMELNKKNNAEWMIFVLLLKEIAKQKKITETQIAKETGMIQSAVSRFFSLKFNPTLDTFIKVSKALNVNYFFEDKDGQSDLNLCFEKAMEELGRRADKLPKN